ncbi:hypothetical protein G6F54_014448 [Rhizopus delemar]|nr:hypothetical protein G6F54_014448 [Rhizopus delemar]
MRFLQGIAVGGERGGPPAAGGRGARADPVVAGDGRRGRAARRGHAVLGLAPAVPRQRRAHRRGPVHPPRHR